MAETGARPRCKCHGTQMHSNGSGWRCADKNIERRRDLTETRVRSNRCVDCGEPTLTAWRCWDCLNKQEAARGIAI